MFEIRDRKNCGAKVQAPYVLAEMPARRQMNSTFSFGGPKGFRRAVVVMPITDI